MQPFAQQAAEYPSLIGMLPYFSAGVRKMSCNRVHFHAITGKKERQRRCMNVARRPKRFGSSANFAAAFYGNPPLRGHLCSAGGLPGRHTGAGVLRGAGLCFTEQRFINGSFLSGFMLFLRFELCLQEHIPLPDGAFPAANAPFAKESRSGRSKKLYRTPFAFFSRIDYNKQTACGVSA